MFGYCLCVVCWPDFICSRCMLSVICVGFCGDVWCVMCHVSMCCVWWSCGDMVWVVCCLWCVYYYLLSAFVILRICLWGMSMFVV